MASLIDQISAAMTRIGQEVKKTSKQVGVPGLTIQAWNAAPIDQSVAVNAAIAAAHARLATTGAGEMKIRIDSPGVVYGSFEMMTGVSLELGPSTMLAAMPAQASSVVDYHSADALHTVLSGGKIMGNYRNGATARCVDMISSNNDAYTIVPPGQPSPQPDFPEIDDITNPNLFAGQWTNPYNVLRDIMIYDCGADSAVYLGVNQRAAMTHNLFVQNCKGIGVRIDATDSMHMNMDVGVCGDCIYILGAATKIMGFKAWYAGRNPGYQSGGGDGIHVVILDAATRAFTNNGECILIGETQDNNRFGWALENGHGIIAKGYSAGDANACIYLGQLSGTVPSLQNCDIQIAHTESDLGGPSKGVWLGPGAAYNTVDLSVDPAYVSGAPFLPIYTTSGNMLDNEDITVHFGQKKGYVNVGVVAGTYNPPQGYAETIALTANTAVTIGPSANIGYRRRLTLRITTGASGSIIWDASWGNAPYVLPSSTVSVTFINTAGASSVPNWVCETANPIKNYVNLFGDGTDGAVNFDGVNTFAAFATKAGNVYTLTRDINTASLAIAAGVTLLLGPWRIFCQTVPVNNGTIGNSGASGTAAGAGGSPGSTAGPGGVGSAGGSGNTGAGTAGASNTGPTLVGGVGGAGSSGAGGAGGQAIIGVSQIPTLRNPAAVLSGIYSSFATARALGGGPGGGGGGGDGVNKGGGGGAGGNNIVIFAPGFINNGTIIAKGGDGGSPATGNCGGGGGGTGGNFFLYSLIAMSGAGTVNLTGGIRGVGIGTGVNGSNGNAGQFNNFIVS